MQNTISTLEHHSYLCALCSNGVRTCEPVMVNSRCALWQKSMKHVYTLLNLQIMKIVEFFTMESHNIKLQLPFAHTKDSISMLDLFTEIETCHIKQIHEFSNITLSCSRIFVFRQDRTYS